MPSSDVPNLNWREQRGFDLLHLQHRAEREELHALAEAGTPVRTLLNLYPLDFEECVRVISEALDNVKPSHFVLFCNNLRALSGSLFDDATAARNSQVHKEIEAGYLLWLRARGSYKRLMTELVERMVELRIGTASTAQTSYARRRAAMEPAEVNLEIIYKALAFAERGVTQPELFMASHLKACIDHVLIFLNEPEIYGGWGTRNRPGRRW